MNGIRSLKQINYSVLNGIADLVRVLDEDNKIVFINEAMEKVLGSNIKNMTCDSESGFYCNAYVAERAFRTGEVIQREELIDGKYYSVKCSPIRGEDGKVLAVVEVFRNTSLEKKLQKELIDKNKAMTVEMKEAQKIQMSLLPQKGFIKNIKLDYIYRPSNILSGDMFDIFRISEDSLGFYIADTVGHGFASSQVTMFIRLMFRNIPQKVLLNPSRTLEEIRKRFSALQLDADIYFTCFYCIYNSREGTLRFANAGHYPCPILNRDGNSYELLVSGFPISRLFDETTYEDNVVDLYCTDRLLFMTDGVIESLNKDRESYGIERVGSILNRTNIDELKELDEDYLNFLWGDQKDDVTAVLLKVL